MSKKILMHKNDKVAKLEASNFYLKDINVFNKKLMPFVCTDSESDNNASFLNWKLNRSKPCSPQNFSNPLLAKIADSYEDISEYVEASISDCYWFKPENSDIIWEDVNYFSLGLFNQEKYIVKFDDKMLKFSDCTDYLSNNLKKDFIRFFSISNNNKFMMARARNFLNRGKDVYNELIGNVVCEALNLNSLEYYILPNNVTCKNRTFTVPFAAAELLIQDDKYEVFTVNDLIRMNIINESNVFEFFNQLGFKEDLFKIFVLDFLILNPNRTFNNLAFIRNSDSLEFEMVSPVFDCSAAFNHFDKANFKKEITNDEFSKSFLGTHSRNLKLIDDFSFVNFDDIKMCCNYIDAILSYSALSSDEKEQILKLFKNQIKKLKEIVNNNLNVPFDKRIKIAKNIKRRFNTEDILKDTGFDPLLALDDSLLYINYLSFEGLKEFESFDRNNSSFKKRFDNFRLDTVLKNKN